MSLSIINENAPADWNLQRLKYIAPLRGDRSDGEEFEGTYVGLENVSSWTGRFIETEDAYKDDASYSTSSVFQHGDVLFGKLRPYLAKCVFADRSGICSTELLVLEPQETVDGRFLNYFLLCPPVIAAIDNSTFGSKMPRANWDFIGDLKIPLPSLCIQQGIAAYLDRETSAIDTLISEKESMLCLLKEKRQALVSHTVTRGLNSKAKMKPTGIEWLETIPKHWHVRRLKYLLETITQGWSPQCAAIPADAGAWGVLKTGCVNGGVFNELANKAFPDDLEPRPDLEVQQGDILMSRASGSVELIGNVAMVSATPRAHLMLSDKVFRLVNSEKSISGDFLVLAMNSKAVRFQIKGFISGAEGLANNIARTDIGEILIPVPPIGEQAEIVAHLKSERSASIQMSDALKRSITLLKERRSALITAAVTGQIKL